MKLKKIRLPIHEKNFKPTSSSYLAKIEGHWYTGKFYAQWYGWVFDAGFLSPQVSYHVNGYSDPEWEKLYEIIEGKSKKGRPWTDPKDNEDVDD